VFLHSSVGNGHLTPSLFFFKTLGISFKIFIDLFGMLIIFQFCYNSNSHRLIQTSKHTKSFFIRTPIKTKHGLRCSWCRTQKFARTNHSYIFFAFNFFSWSLWWIWTKNSLRNQIAIKNLEDTTSINSSFLLLQLSSKYLYFVGDVFLSIL
jgi:hypothetical protein